MHSSLYASLNDQERVLYDFFITFGTPMESIEYPLSILNIWKEIAEGVEDATDPGIMYAKREAVLEAYHSIGNLDKPLYLAIEKIKGWNK